MQTLEGRTCVFAGATAGDGVDAVKQLCAGGMNVIMMTHMVERAARLVDEINGMGLPGRCMAIGALETGPAEEDRSTYEKIAKEFGSVDVLISNTGSTGPDTAIEEVRPSALLHSVEHLLGGAFGMLSAALPYLKQSKAPRVIFMTTPEGAEGGVHESFENAVAKGAVRSLALNAAARLAPCGITVNCISKGPIPRIEGIRSGEVDPAKMLGRIPMGRLGTAEDLGHLICFLASEESSYITGQTIELSGGLAFRD